MTCNEETPLLHDTERNLKTTVFHMVLSFLALSVCVMLIVLPIIIASIFLLSSGRPGDYELSSSVLLHKLQPNYLESRAIQSKTEAIQYQFLLPHDSIGNTNPTDEVNIELLEEPNMSDDTKQSTLGLIKLGSIK